jgi:hypothetical protein
VLEARGNAEAVEMKERAVALGRQAIDRSKEVPAEWREWLAEVERPVAPGETRDP